MSRQSKSELVVSCLLALSTLACGDGTGVSAPPSPHELQIVAGDRQRSPSRVPHFELEVSQRLGHTWKDIKSW
jgi:hypothetical protein